ncbi:conserved membrane protein of unknown function [Candidatus Hydrogenisulfobacillus filiaventi]|uniref:DUF2029 domain-containing protein n=1 Tax=Candidatus Hydrogenisulfobacillus filiaventi TaxID=2707344 RepID=A0A6F8ZDA6_9FIRM|nr:hypothetical protein [Bacillota bacterium]CAB1127996.1 conserved membrane protein of unknown function [Candidatus Hydrogenisulfobacillus filiaventi]
MSRRDLGLLLLLTAAAAVLAAWTRPVDVREYAAYSRALLHPPWGWQWPREYPPVADAVFLLPRLLPLPYASAFVLAAVLALTGYWLVIPAPERGRFFLYAVLGSLSTLAARYDLAPALLTWVGVGAAARGRYRTAWAALVLGAALKLFPLALFPLLALQERRQAGRRAWGHLGAAMALTGLLLAFPLLWHPHDAGAAAWIRWLLRRPPQVGSAAAVLTALAGGRARFAFGAVAIIGPAWPALLPLALGLGLWGRAAWRLRRGTLAWEAAATAALSALLLASKVFSPQYLIWLLPLWARQPLRPWRVGVALITGLGWPWLYLPAVARMLHSPWLPVVGLLLPLNALRAVLLLPDAWGAEPAAAGARSLRAPGGVPLP